MKTFVGVPLVMLLHTQAFADMLFVGVMKTPTKTLVALKDSTSQTSAWVDLGGSFAGYRVVEITPDLDIVKLEQSGTLLNVRLQGSKIESVDDDDPSTRAKRLSAVINDIGNHAMARKRSWPEPEELILLAARYGRIVLSREIKDGAEQIIFGPPGSTDFSGQKLTIKMGYSGKSGSKKFVLTIQ